MSEGEQAPVYHTEPTSNTGKWVLIAVAIAYVAGSLYFLFDLHTKLDKVTQDQTVSQKQIGDLTKRMESAEADAETVAQQVGMTKKELAEKSAQLRREQQASVARLAEEQKKQYGEVSGDLANVKTDVGGVKTDLGSMIIICPYNRDLAGSEYANTAERDVLERR